MREVCDEVQKRAAKFKIAHSKNRCFHSNFDSIFRFGLKKSEFGILRNDKDGGFCLIGRDAIDSERDRLLDSGKYRKCKVSDLDLPSIVQEYRDCIKEIQNVTRFSGFENTCLRPLRTMRPESLLSLLDMNVKSHKGDGEVEMRPIHASSGHPFAPGMRFVSNAIYHYLRDHGHILRDSDDLIGKLPSYEIESSDTMYKIDVKDFFMSGAIQRLTDTCTSATPSAVNGNVGFRKTFRDLLSILLRAQFVVKSKNNLTADSDVWQVMIGSGMGLISSGAISDFVFFCLCEVNFLLHESTRRTYHIKAYARFKDDLFIVLGGDKANRIAFYRELQSKASSVFKLKVDSISTSCVEMLDLLLYKGSNFQRGGVIDYCVRIRNSALGVVLSDSSMHPRGVHCTWPVARVSVIRKRCCDGESAKLAVSEFVNKLKASCPSHVSLQYLCAGPGIPRSNPRQKHVSSWIVIPHHPLYERGGFSSLIAGIFSRWCTSLAGAGEDIDDLRISIAWSLGGRSLKSRLTKV